MRIDRDEGLAEESAKDRVKDPTGGERMREFVPAELNDGSWWSDSEGELRGSERKGVRF